MERFKTFLAALMLCAAAATARQVVWWDDIARPVEQVGDLSISALAVGGGRLYIAGMAGGGQKAPPRAHVLVLDLKSSRLEDATPRLASAPIDEITAIWIDEARGQLWVVTNHNVLTPDRYDLEFRLQRKYSDARSVDLDGDAGLEFVAQRARSNEEAGRACSTSAQILALDATQAVVGCFKGDLLLYRFADKRAQRVSPGSPAGSVTSAALAQGVAFAGTGGDGLVVIDRATARSVRVPARAGRNRVIDALEVSGDQLFIGAGKLYRSPVSALRALLPATPARQEGR